MIDISKKQDCLDSLAKALLRTRDWRLGMRSKYPDDPRLVKSAKTLDRLAGETSELSDEAFFAISPYFNWSSAHWTNAVSLAARRVEYHHDVRTFSAFVNTLIAILRVAA